MTDTLQLNLLGIVNIQRGDTPLTDFASTKTQALLIYLAVTGQPHRRDSLAALFWGHAPDHRAKKNLRDALSNLRKQVGPYVSITRHEVAFNRAAPHQVDVTEFEQATDLDTALSWYGGDFLAGFHVREAPDFEDWVATQRERLHQLAVQTLEAAADEALARADLSAGLVAANHLLRLEPWHEAGHRLLMRLLAQGGQRGAALAQYEVCRQVLADELGVSPAAETTALYKRLKTAAETRPHNLPPAPTAFVGRSETLAQVHTYLHTPQCRLLTLLGPGGIGKTRLALEAARRYTAPDALLPFNDGVFFVPLASLSTATYLVSAIAEALTLPLQGATHPRQHLLDHLRQTQHGLLLVLDNFEHLLDGVDLLIDMLQVAPQVMLLVTSRERLNLHEEWLLELTGLAWPAADQPAEPAETYSAIALFLQRARQLRPGFKPTEADLGHIIRLCRQVAGLPLALELAAGWLPVLTCAEIVAEIDRSLDFLTTATRNIPPRHRSLRLVFEQSWQLLSAQAQQVLARLTVFAGGFQREAAHQIANASLATLAELVDKSLLRRTEQGRYELHELLRQYAAEALSDEAAALTRQRHSDYYLQQVEANATALISPTAQQAVVGLRLELDNIRQGWQWAVRQHRLDLLSHSLTGLSRFYEIRGLFEEGATTFAAAAAQLVARPDGYGLRGRLLAEQALMLIWQGQPATALAQAALNLARTAQLADLEARARHVSGLGWLYSSEFEPAQTHLDHALTLARRAELPYLAVEVLCGAGEVAKELGEYPRSEVIFTEALTQAQQLGHLRAESLALKYLGALAEERGDYRTAWSRYEQALHGVRTLDSPFEEGRVLNNMGLIAYNRGEYMRAEEIYQRTLRSHRRTGHRRGEGIATYNLGNVYRALGDYAGARQQYEAALRLNQETGNQLDGSYIFTALALLHHHLEQNDAAASFSQQACELAQAIGARSPEAMALTYWGHALTALGQPDRAEALYEQALTLRHQLGERRRSIETLAGLVRAYLAQGQLHRVKVPTDTILHYLAQDAPYGAAEPIRIYWTCYEVLQAADDPRATKMLAAAWQQLQVLATAIPDESRRQRFLTAVRVHRYVLGAAESTAAA